MYKNMCSRRFNFSIYYTCYREGKVIYLNLLYTHRGITVVILNWYVILNALNTALLHLQTFIIHFCVCCFVRMPAETAACRFIDYTKSEHSMHHLDLSCIIYLIYTWITLHFIAVLIIRILYSEIRICMHS